MKRVLTVFLALVAFVSGAAYADATTDRIRTAMKKLVADVDPDSIAPSQIPGMYEVRYGMEVVYVSEDGKFLISGSLIDIESGKDLTEDKRAQGRKALISSIDESKMIIFSPEKVKHKITVFTDIDCMYCRRMHSEIDELNKLGIEVRYLFFPRAGLNSKSYKKAVSVWCADNRQEALTQAKLGKPVDQKTCDNPIDEHMALVNQLGLTGTPSSVLANGQLIPGYIPADRYAKVLNEIGGL